MTDLVNGKSMCNGKGRTLLPKFCIYAMFLPLSCIFSGCVFLAVLPGEIVDGVAHMLGLSPEDKSLILLHKAQEAHRSQQYDVAEEYYLKAIEEDKKEDDKRKEKIPWGGPYGGLSGIYAAQGRYAEAIKAKEKAWQLQMVNDDRMLRKYPTHQRNDGQTFYWGMGIIYVDRGQYDLALRNYDLALKAVEAEAVRWETGNQRAIREGWRPEFFKDQANQTRELGVAQTNWHVGTCYLSMGEYEKARNCFQVSLDNWLKHNLVREDQGGKSRALLGIAYYYLGDEAKAEELLRGSAEVAFLARIAERRRDVGKALDIYLSVLRASREEKPLEHRTQQADALNQLGGFYLRQANLEESSKAFNEAKSLREVTTTATHPDYAVTLKGLAAIAVSRNELTSATLLARKALDVLDASIVPTHPRIAPVLVTLASTEVLNGHPEEAAKINQRLETLLQDRPLAIWKEDFLWTANFYAGVLEKAGKIPEAAALRQIHDRQKDRK